MFTSRQIYSKAWCTRTRSLTRSPTYNNVFLPISFEEFTWITRQRVNQLFSVAPTTTTTKNVNQKSVPVSKGKIAKSNRNGENVRWWRSEFRSITRLRLCMCMYWNKRKDKKVLNLYAIELFSGDLFSNISYSQCIPVYVYFLHLAGCKSILQSVYVNVVCMYKYIAYERFSLPVSGIVSEQRMSWHRRQRHFVYLAIYINIETYFQYMWLSIFTHEEMEMELHATYNRM